MNYLAAISSMPENPQLTDVLKHLPSSPEDVLKKLLPPLPEGVFSD
ncbi:hypothetical protein OOO55_004023 [Salmonella enterica]|nr:hypothetical protein [Salmonella enterica]